MNIIIGIIISLGITLAVFILAAIIVNFRKWKSYKTIYKTLPEKHFMLHFGVIIDESDDFVFWLDGKSFTLSYPKNIYLHNSIVTYFDPYSLFWYIKYRLYFKHLVA